MSLKCQQTSVNITTKIPTLGIFTARLAAITRRLPMKISSLATKIRSLATKIRSLPMNTGSLLHEKKEAIYNRK